MLTLGEGRDVEEVRKEEVLFSRGRSGTTRLEATTTLPE